MLATGRSRLSSHSLTLSSLKHTSAAAATSRLGATAAVARCTSTTDRTRRPSLLFAALPSLHRRHAAAASYSSTAQPLPSPAAPSASSSGHAVAGQTGHGSSARGVILKLLQNISSRSEIEQYLKFYAAIDTPKFAVIKVGGGIIMDELDTLASSLAFLAEVGLLPVVIHGAGPQLNEQLKRQGIESDYIGGMRITTPDILRTARQVFNDANLKLVRALEDRGVRARPIVSGVFGAEFLDQSQYQYVGQISKVDTSSVHHALSSGCVPVLTCMGESASGQRLNINADVAAQELAKALRPLKIIYLSQNGGISDQHDKLMSVIDLDTDFERLMVEPWFRHGNRLKLKEIKTLLDALPITSSVAITSAANLPRELFTTKGSGTLVKRSEKILCYTSLNEIDREKLTHLLETAFNGRLHPAYLDQLKPHIHRIYLTESYRTVAIITKDASDPNSVPYLDKFAVAKTSQSEGSGQALWNVLRRDVTSLYWRSRRSNPINPWYFEHSDGSYVSEPWVVFWYGLKDLEQVTGCIEKARGKGASIDRAQQPFEDGIKSDIKVDGNHSVASSFGGGPISAAAARSTASPGASMQAAGSARSFSTRADGRRHLSSYARTARNNKPSKVGLIGARGHTGGELIALIARHPQLSISVASSRALKGQSLSAVFKQLPSSVPWSSTQFTDLKPAELPSQDVDVWVLALPNGLAAPYVEALEAAGRKDVKVVDLSADYRFNKQWAYGFPEHKGYRECLAAATRVANPGCYATGAQAALLPLADVLDTSYPPTVFGVSGYSGAGTTASRKNDPAELKDNLMPYSLLGHMHEREVSSQLASFLPSGIRFMPHVAPWFRGISLTTAVQLKRPMNKADVLRLFQQYYDGEALISVVEGIPEVRQIQNQHGVIVGGFEVDGRGRLVVTSVIDNLLKGAATQCLQNVNLVQGYDEYAGIPLK